MYKLSNQNRKFNIGFVSTRFAGTDGVSLETEKWAEVLRELGHPCFYFSGESDHPEEISSVIPEAHFQHPEVAARHQGFFEHEQRKIDDTAWIHAKTKLLKHKLYEFKERFEIEVLIPENCLAIPLHLPLGLAITEFIAETQIPTIAHHHDFSWERKRFLVNNVSEFLSMAFPPDLRPIQHVTINSSARYQLAMRKGVVSTVIPNIMPFETSPPGMDDYNHDLRAAMDISEDQILVLQPTRVVQRKGIEHAIELLAWLEMDPVLVISHASGDEGNAYDKRLRNYADMMGVRTIFAAEIIGDKRGRTPDGRKIYSLWDAYPHADLVTYPSLIEGFGNAFLEAIYFKKLIVVNNYPIYNTDIRPKGFQVIEFDGFVTEETVEKTRRLLTHPTEVSRMAEHNYNLALKYFSYQVLQSRIAELIETIAWH